MKTLELKRTAANRWDSRPQGEKFQNYLANLTREQLERAWGVKHEETLILYESLEK